MATFKDKGIVLREAAYNESDKHVTLLLKERGKLTVSARGARKPQSKLSAATQTFAYGEFVIYDGGGFYTLAQAEALEGFYAVRETLEGYCYAAYFMELTDRFLLREMDAREPLRLILRGLQALARGVPKAGLTAAVFTYKFLQTEGYSPVTEACAACGEALQGGRLFFTGEGLCCPSCLRTLDANGAKALRIGAPTLHAIQTILQNDADGLFRMNATSDLQRELEQTAKLFREANVEHGFKSLEMLE